MSLTEAAIAREMHRARALPVGQQRLVMERLTTKELETADLIASGLRSGAGHAETPGDPDICDTCGRIEPANKRVASAFHPLVLLG